MASTQHVLLSPAELAYLHTSLAQTPPIRPDGRTATQFRTLRAETGLLPGANGSARVFFADGTEAIVGVKAQVETTPEADDGDGDDDGADDDEAIWGAADDMGDDDGGGSGGKGNQGSGSGGGRVTASPAWVEVTVEIPGVRDDDASTVFLAALLAEALLADGGLAQALRINRRFHWKLYLDILLISPPLSYPLPLLSLTTHLALLATRLPRLVSEGDEDPFFDDDWDAATFLYPRSSTPSKTDDASKTTTTTRDGGDGGKNNNQDNGRRPPITLLVTTVADNILFDPTAEELAVANAVLAVSVGQAAGPSPSSSSSSSSSSSPSLRLLAIRTIDPPSRLTAPGAPYQQQQQQSPLPAPHEPGRATPTAATPSTPSSAGASASIADDLAAAAAAAAPSRLPETEPVYGVWRAPRGGAKVALLAAMTQKVLETGGVAEEVFAGLDGVEIV
ncbi:3 exoribonuclease family protein [Niveomyces insectorum RCEF 264]|uniref:Ribosomal RNA-processing protein 42 n=1 Tax=Niveomyces insectorum RCEF 264 TaxID=1081102 RepID=A0A168AIH3_9HYPO|nr:3 exoribonuclease family protein [Niveomyces insectorum RCEF 264]